MQHAYVFPGQGSQSQNMLANLAPHYPLIKQYFSQASEILNQDLWRIITENPDDKLNQTQLTQPILLAADVSLFYCLRGKNYPVPNVMAGHSLGEYAALVCAEVLNFSDAVKLVAKRGEFMQEAVPAGVGAMAAIVGLDDAMVVSVCVDAAKGQIVAPANYNSLGQVVIAGDKAAVERAIEIAKNCGAKIAKMIPVSVPSHCQLMQPAAEKLAILLGQTEFSMPTIDVIQNADVRIHKNPESMREALIQQLTHPVRWVDTIMQMQKNFNINSITECGPGKVLNGLIKRIDKNIAVETAETILGVPE